MMDPNHQLTTADLREFSRKVRDAVHRFDSRKGGAVEAANTSADQRRQSPLDPDTDFISALEELGIADEELRQQNEELERSRDDLARERKKYYELFDFAPDAYLVTDSRGSIVEANVAATQLLGVPSHFLLGKPLPVFFEEGAKRSYRQQLDRLCGADRIDDWEIGLLPRNGDAIAVSVSVGRVAGRDKSISGYRWILRDITKRKQAEDAVRQLNRELEVRVSSRTTQLAAANKIKDELLLSERKARETAEVSNRVKSEFLSLLSHEFRTPLQAIFGYTELLEREIHGPINDAQRRDLYRVRQSQQHLLGLINTILEFAKLESGQPIEVSFQAVPMQEALQPMEALIGPALETKNLAYEYKCTDPSVIAYAEPAKVQQIVVNLLGNAVKYTPAGGSIRLECTMVPDAVEVRVTDTGPGIPGEKIDSVFEPFVQLKQHGTPSNGTGLGLPISRRLAAAMGGALTVESEEGVGSTFILRLQRADARTPPPNG